MNTSRTSTELGHKGSSPRKSGATAVMLAAGLSVTLAAPAFAQDFFSALFSGFGARPSPPMSAMSYGNEPDTQFPPRASRGSGGGAVAYCVRTCDGRYFPVPAAANQSRAETCKSFCPATETRVFYGRTIDEATAENGKDYSDLPNAFKYRSELVAGCSCNGTDPVGLAKVDIKDDKTLRQGDFVAATDGLKVVNGRPQRGAELNFSPAPHSVRARYDRSLALQ